MPRYIDADWIVQKLEGWQDQLAEAYGENDEYVLCLGEVLMKLDDTPTADVVEVVRCKYCDYAHGYTTGCGLYGGITCERIDMDVDEMFYCGYGEVKVDAERSV